MKIARKKQKSKDKISLTLKHTLFHSNFELLIRLPDALKVRSAGNNHLELNLKE